ncbi:MAG: LCP family protein [Hungatella sp.]|nr:LCP family protein [Hungatella sp.]
MEYQDEVERMRARRQRKNQPQTRKSSLKDLEIIEFDDLERQRAPHRAPEGHRKGPKSLEPTLRYARDERSEAIARQVRAERKRESMVRQAAEESRKKRARRKRKIVVFELLLLCVLLGGIFFYFRKSTESKYWTVAVFGVDSRDGGLEKDNHSDVEMICVLNRETGEIRIVSVFRDTYLQVSEEGKYHKANQAYFDGGHKQAVEALERNLDLKIDDYATFNWKAVADAITILGGIDLEISESEFAYINGFITETVNSTGLGSYQLEHPGMQHLDGVQAVAYARLRLMDTDYNRTARQRLVISLAMEKAKQADLGTLTTVLNTVMPQISTSVGINDLLPLAKSVKKFHIGESGGFPFSRGETYIGKMDCVIPLTLESNVIQLHQFLYEDMEYQPSSTVKRISVQIAADSGMGDVAENAPEARVGGSSKSSSGQSPETQPSAPETPADTAEAVPEVSTELVQEEETLSEEASTEETEGSLGKEESEKSESSGEETVESTQKPIEIGPGIGPGESSSSSEPMVPGYGSGGPGVQPESTADSIQEPIGPGNPGPSSEG